jgi:tetratricopeptide (TPR) repeat protein/S1-C subfamily serine protease
MKNAALLIASLLLTQIPIQPVTSLPFQSTIAQLDEGILTPQQIQQTAKNITVRITSATNGGSGVIIAQKGSNYLILTNAHVVKRAARVEIQAPDGQKYQATAIDGGFNSKYDLALLQFTSQTKYTLANLASVAGSPIEASRTIYSAGFPFDSKDIRITSGEVSQLSDLPFDDGTQIGYTIDKDRKGIRQGMSGGAIFDAQGNFLGINTVSAAPILPNYTYNDGSKPIPKLATKYASVNWGIPIYNFLTNVKADILYGYENLPKVEHQVPPTGYMAKLNTKTRQMTVRIENSGGNGSGVIIAKEGNSYYILTAKHVLQDYQSNQEFTNHQIITYDQDRRGVTATIVAEGVDLAVMKFSSNSNYPVAKLSGYSTKDDDLTFVGGFPGRDKINSPLWQWQLNPGFVSSQATGKLKTETNQSFSNGYDLIYSSISYGGMSGGPVFDPSGNIVGIHGRTEGTDINSLGISIQTFTGLVKARKMQIAPNLFNLLTIEPNYPVALNSIDRNNVISTMENISTPQAEDIGKRWLDYGNQLYRTRQYSKSIAAFNRAISKGEKILGNYGKASALKAVKQIDFAAMAIAQSIAAVPSIEKIGYYYLWSKQATLLQDLSRYEEALKSVEIAISLKQDDLLLRHEKAVILFNQKKYASSITIENDLIRTNPEWFFHVIRGLSKEKIGDNQGALQDFNSAIELNPNGDGFYGFRGLVKIKTGDYQGALKDANRSIELSPNNDLNYMTRAIIKLVLKDGQGALKDADRSIKLDPRNPENHNIRGVVRSQLGDNKNAIDDYSKAIELNPKNANYYASRAGSKYTLRDNKGALDDSNKAIGIDRNIELAYSIRGKAKSALGDKQGAIADFNRSIELNPNSSDGYVNRSIIKAELGDKQSAIKDMAKAAELFRQQGQMDLATKAMSIVEKLKKQ